MLGCQTSAGWSADLYCFKFGSFFQSSADIINNLTQSRSHRYFDQTGILNTSGQREGLRSRTSLCSDGTEPRMSLQNDLRNIGISFYVVQYSWFCPQTMVNRSWWFCSWHTTISFDGSCQCTSFSADKCACTTIDMHMETEIRS